MTLAEIIVELRARASQTVPFAGDALGDLKRGAAYAAAKDGTLGVETFWSGGKLRTASIDIARRLGVEDAVTAKNDKPVEAPAPASPASAPQITTRKASVRQASTSRRLQRGAAAGRPSESNKQKEQREIA
jgi:hypothetical protein